MGVDIGLDGTVRCKANGGSVGMKSIGEDAAGLAAVWLVAGGRVGVRVGTGVGGWGGIPMCCADAGADWGCGLILVWGLLRLLEDAGSRP